MRYSHAFYGDSIHRIYIYSYLHVETATWPLWQFQKTQQPDSNNHAQKLRLLQDFINHGWIAFVSQLLLTDVQKKYKNGGFSFEFVVRWSATTLDRSQTDAFIWHTVTPLCHFGRVIWVNFEPLNTNVEFCFQK